MKTDTPALRELLESPSLEFLMEAHNGISARIVQEAGFNGIWASGLAMSAQFGVRDSNEASWTQIVDMLEFMSDATTIPILLDGDTGYGNFNNLRRLIGKLEQRGIAGVCIEDKLFPKTNSYINSERQPLCDVDEFCSKIRAGKDSQRDSDFCLVARTEALIAGWGMDEALRRAEAYREAGADAILIHSKRSSPDEILIFAERFNGRLPLIIVPTTYYSTPTEIFRQAGISVVIWANHLLRAAVASMASTAREIRRTETLVNIEDNIAPVSEIFRLQGADELLEAEQRYLNSRRADTSAIVLAASRGHNNMHAITETRPKVMLPVAGTPLLRRLIDELKNQNIHRITVVTGYKGQAIVDMQSRTGIEVAHNPRHRDTGELSSLLCARKALTDNTILIYGDLLFRSYILRDLLERQDEIVVIVDSVLPDPTTAEYRDIAYCSRPDDYSLFAQDVSLNRIAATPHPDAPPPSGRWIGIMRAQGLGRNWILKALDELAQRADADSLGMTDLINHLIDRGRPVKVMYIHGHWLDVNRLEDIPRAADFARGQVPLRDDDD